MMRGTRWKETARKCLATLHRELKVTLTPVPKPEKWIFVVGCYNSGTTLLAQLLGAHPKISALPEEGQFLTDQFRSDFELGVGRMWVVREDYFRLSEGDTGPDEVRLKKEWGMRADRSKAMILEKSPPNSARTRWLQQKFEHSHFIAIVRNGYAVAEGIRRKASPFHLPGGWPLDQCARQWARCNEVLLEDSKYLQQMLWVRYEDLTGDTPTELARIGRFLGVETGPWDSVVGSKWVVHERQEPIRNLNAESLDRLSDADIEIVTAICRPMLEHFGYEVLAASRA